MSAGWIISLMVVVVAVCAGLAAMGFRGRVTTIGVDLGTTFSVVGFNKAGKVIIVEDKEGHKIFPSVVSYKDGGEIIAAYAALAELSKRPENTIYNAKRFIGQSLADEKVQLYASEHSFSVVESSLSNYSQVGFKINATGHPPVVTPEQVGTQVLRYLLKVTADFMGHDQVNKAVIAVPAKFSPLQRQATAEAYKQAGLKVIRVIEEPTAAAVAYRLHKKSSIHHILVYDFGGGTLDVSLLYVAKGSVQVYATDGDETLGGSDFDICLYNNIKQKILDRTGVDIASIHLSDYTGSDSNQQSEDDLCIAPSVHTKAEETKKRLTNSTDVEFSCVMPKTYNNGETIRFNINRAVDFEGGCSELFQRGMTPVTRLLEDLSMTKEDIDEVVLVGGSTRVPLVKQQLRDYFGKDLNDHIDPDITVAYGAASIMD